MSTNNISRIETQFRYSSKIWILTDQIKSMSNFVHYISILGAAEQLKCLTYYLTIKVDWGRCSIITHSSVNDSIFTCTYTHVIVDSDFCLSFSLSTAALRFYSTCYESSHYLTMFEFKIFFNVHFSLLYGLIHLDKPEEIQRRQFLQLVKETSNYAGPNIVLLGYPTLWRKSTQWKRSLTNRTVLYSYRTLASVIRRFLQRYWVV